MCLFDSWYKGFFVRHIGFDPLVYAFKFSVRFFAVPNLTPCMTILCSLWVFSTKNVIWRSDFSVKYFELVGMFCGRVQGIREGHKIISKSQTVDCQVYDSGRMTRYDVRVWRWWTVNVSRYATSIVFILDVKASLLDILGPIPSLRVKIFYPIVFFCSTIWCSIWVLFS